MSFEYYFITAVYGFSVFVLGVKFLYGQQRRTAVFDLIDSVTVPGVGGSVGTGYGDLFAVVCVSEAMFIIGACINISRAGFFEYQRDLGAVFK